MSEKPIETKKLLDKMRTNRDQQNRKTVATPLRRTRKKMQNKRQGDGAEKQK